MKSVKIIALLVAIGFSFTACGTSGKGKAAAFLNGAWINTSEDASCHFVLDGNNWVFYDGDKQVSKGKWTSNVPPDAGGNGVMTFTIDQVDRGKGWVSLGSESKDIQSCTVVYSINLDGNQLILSRKQLAADDPTGLWKKLEGVYMREGSIDIDGNAVSSGRGTGGSAGSDSQTANQSRKTAGPNDPPVFYIITGGGTSFTARKNGTTVVTANQTMTIVIDAIKTDADGSNVAIQFGNGTSALNIGAASVSFDNDGGNWSRITLSGKITSSTSPTIGAYRVFITSTADISTSSNGGSAIINSGTFIINDGTVSTHGANTYGIRNSGGRILINHGHISPRGEGIYNESDSGRGGSVTITGGTVHSMTNRAIYNNNGCTVTIIGGTVSSSSSDSIYNSGGTVKIAGGTLSGGHSGHVIWNTDSGTVTISGGTVTTTNNHRRYAAISNDSGCTVIISGGSVVVPDGNAINNASGGTVTITNPKAVIIGNMTGI